MDVAALKDKKHFQSMAASFFRARPQAAAFKAQEVPFVLVIDENSMNDSNAERSALALHESIVALEEKGVSVKLLYQGDGPSSRTEQNPLWQEGGLLRQHAYDDFWHIRKEAMARHLESLEAGNAISGTFHYQKMPKEGERTATEDVILSDVYAGPMLLKTVLERVSVKAGLIQPEMHAYESTEALQRDLDYNLKMKIGGKAYGLLEMMHIAAENPEAGITNPKFIVLETSHCQKELGLMTDGTPEESGWRAFVTQKVAQGGVHSVRSGAPVSMPGMMHSVLNVGITTQKIREDLQKSSEEGIKTFKDYAIFAQSYHKAIAETDPKAAEKVAGTLAGLHQLIAKVDETGDLNLKELQVFEDAYVQGNIPNQREEQYIKATQAVMASWNSNAAIKYREMNAIPHSMGTAIIIQDMVRPEIAGVVFSHNLTSGEEGLYGNYGQNDDVVAGQGQTYDIENLRRENPEVYKKLKEQMAVLKKYSNDMPLDVEFCVTRENGLFLLQKRAAILTPEAELNRLCIDLETASSDGNTKAIQNNLLKMDSVIGMYPELKNLKKLAPTDANPIAQGVPICANAVVGIAITPDGNLSPNLAFKKAKEEMQALRENGQAPILVLSAHSYQNFDSLVKDADGLLIVEGGNKASHAAVAARQYGKACVGAVENFGGEMVTVAEFTGKPLTISEKGQIYLGKLGIEAAPVPAYERARELAQACSADFQENLPNLTGRKMLDPLALSDEWHEHTVEEPTTAAPSAEKDALERA